MGEGAADRAGNVWGGPGGHWDPSLGSQVLWGTAESSEPSTTVELDQTLLSPCVSVAFALGCRWGLFRGPG